MNLKNGLFLLTILIALFSLFFVAKFVGFAINVSSSVTIEPKIIVNYSLFDGSTTDLSSMSNIQLQNIQGLTLERTRYGKIIFLQSVNLTQDNKNGIVDINSNVNIFDNDIKINTNNLTSLEKPAVLYLYNLSFNNPRVLRNGDVCSSLLCQIINYSSGTLVFSVNRFSDYSAQETPAVAAKPSPSSSSGGGSWSALTKDFSLDKDLIKVSIKQGENAKEYLVIKDTGNTDINISLNISKLERFMILSDENFVLKVGESKMIDIDFFAKEDEIADSYLGKIIVSGGGVTKTAGIILEVKEKNPLFDIKTQVLNNVVKPGEKVNVQIKITNMGDLNHIDVILYTALKNLNGEVISYKDESIAVEKELNINRSMDVPELAYGKYIFYSRVSYQNINASSSDVFEVATNAKTSGLGGSYSNFILIEVILILVIIVVYIIYLKRKVK